MIILTFKLEFDFKYRQFSLTTLGILAMVFATSHRDFLH